MVGNKFQVYRNTDIAKKIDSLYESSEFLREYLLAEFCEPDSILDPTALAFAQKYEEYTRALSVLTKSIKGRELIKIQYILDDLERGR